MVSLQNTDTWGEPAPQRLHEYQSNAITVLFKKIMKSEAYKGGWKKLYFKWVSSSR